MKDLEAKLEKARKKEEQRKKEKIRKKTEDRYEDLPGSIYHKLYKE